jgi:hypothetical protein
VSRSRTGIAAATSTAGRTWWLAYPKFRGRQDSGYCRQDGVKIEGWRARRSSAGAMKVLELPKSGGTTTALQPSYGRALAG